MKITKSDIKNWSVWEKDDNSLADHAVGILELPWCTLVKDNSGWYQTDIGIDEFMNSLSCPVTSYENRLHSTSVSGVGFKKDGAWWQLVETNEEDFSGLLGLL